MMYNVNLSMFILFQFRDDMESSRTQYLALNSQLVEELPKLISCSLTVYTAAVNEFIMLRKLFVGRVTRELLALMDVSLKERKTKS